jgi:hypothetical protein
VFSSCELWHMLWRKAVWITRIATPCLQVGNSGKVGTWLSPQALLYQPWDLNTPPSEFMRTRSSQGSGKYAGHNACSP